MSKEELNKYIKEQILAELTIQLATHALSCDRICGGDSQKECSIRLFLLSYRAEFMKEYDLKL